MGYSRFRNNLGGDILGGMLCLDEARGGWWLDGNDILTRTRFLSKTGAVTIFNNGCPTDAAVAYYPPADMLVGWRYQTNNGQTSFIGWDCDQAHDTIFHTLSVTVTAPTVPQSGPLGQSQATHANGIVWCENLGGFTIYEAAGGGGGAFTYGPNRVFFLKPPAVGREYIDDWVLSCVDFVSADSIPVNVTDSINGGGWGMVEIPAWCKTGQSTMLWCGSASAPPQVFVMDAL
jgi:hypothetical protein